MALPELYLPRRIQITGDARKRFDGDLRDLQSAPEPTDEKDKLLRQIKIDALQAGAQERDIELSVLKHLAGAQNLDQLRSVVGDLTPEEEKALTDNGLGQRPTAEVFEDAFDLSKPQTRPGQYETFENIVRRGIEHQQQLQQQ